VNRSNGSVRFLTLRVPDFPQRDFRAARSDPRLAFPVNLASASPNNHGGAAANGVGKPLATRQDLLPKRQLADRCAARESRPFIR
jgi:hypothetical protein